jgi:hypothetical protein
MNGYYLLLEYLQELALSDNDCNTFTDGDGLVDADLDRQEIYPLVHLASDTGNFVNGVIQINLEIFALDQYDEQLDNDRDIYNTQLYVLKRIFNRLSISEGVSLLGDGSFQKVEKKENNLIGWSLSLVVEVSDDVMRFC